MRDEYQQIEALRQKVTSLKKTLTSAKEEYRDLLNKKDDLLEKAAKIKAEVDAAAVKRDAINKEVQNLKRRIEDLVKEKSDIKLKIEGKEKELSEAKSKLLGGEEHLDRKLMNLEWRLITGGVSAKEESAIVSSIAELHQKLATYERVKRIDGELRTLREEGAKRKGELRKLLEEKKKLLDESRGFHESFIQSSEKRKNVLEEVANLRERIKELKTKMGERFMELVSLNAEITLHESKIKKAREELKVEKQRLAEAKKVQVAQSAAEKLRRGESLSWEEFKIHMERSSDD